MHASNSPTSLVFTRRRGLLGRGRRFLVVGSIFAGVLMVPAVASATVSGPARPTPARHWFAPPYRPQPQPQPRPPVSHRPVRHHRPVGPPGIAVSLVVTAGGGTAIGGAVSLNVTITSTGTAPLHVGTVSGTNLDTLESNCSNVTLNHGATCTFGIGYLLTAPTSTVTIPSDAPSSPTVLTFPH